MYYCSVPHKVMSQIIGELNWLEQVRVSMVSDMCDMCVQ